MSEHKKCLGWRGVGGKALEGKNWEKSHLEKLKTLCVYLESLPSNIFVFNNLSLKRCPKTGHGNVGLDHLGVFSSLGHSMSTQVLVLPLGGLGLVQESSLD